MNLIYQTQRLKVSEIFTNKQAPKFLVSVMKVLTSKVVENLPPYFQNIDSISSVKGWLEQIISTGRLFNVELLGENYPIGFVFLSTENTNTTHIGYLLGEPYWGNGYATEILKGLIEFVRTEGKVTHLIAGVTTDNVVSINLLHKLGFIKSSTDDIGTLFFEYRL